MQLVRAPPMHQTVRFPVTDHQSDDLDELARSSPTALVMALERALGTQDRALERAVLAALGELGIVVVDRSTLARSVAPRRARPFDRRTRT